MIESLPLGYATYKQCTARRQVFSFGFSYDFDANVRRDALDIPRQFEFLLERIAAWTGVPPRSIV